MHELFDFKMKLKLIEIKIKIRIKIIEKPHTILLPDI